MHKVKSISQKLNSKKKFDIDLMEIKYFISILTYTWFGPNWLFFGVIRNSFQKTINYSMKIGNFNPIKKRLVVWFLFGPFYTHKYPFTWIHDWFLRFILFGEATLPMKCEKYSCAEIPTTTHAAHLISRETSKMLGGCKLQNISCRQWT